ncbi:MAG: redoxin domain-containing protein [Lachnospiraceae bacterium]|nr:redoxin domain-containing protein [Lachnospiraceae bacterium]
MYDFKVNDETGKEVSLSDYKGKVRGIENAATRCGFTPQYKELQALYDEFEKEGLVILDFPSRHLFLSF